MTAVARWSPDELTGQPIPAYIHPGDLPTIAERVQRLFAGETLPPSEFRLRCRDGGYVWLEGVEVPIRDGVSGQITSLQASGRDISARKASEELFGALAALPPVGIFRTDATGAATFVNSRWTEITGIPAAQALASGWLDAVHPDDRAIVAQDWADELAGTRAPGCVFRIVRPDGEIRHVATDAVKLHDAEGNVAGWVGSMTDITAVKAAETERQQLEARLLEAQRLESLGVLAGGVAHDFNNLLVGVLGNASLALSELPEASPVRDSVEQIQTAARRAADLTRQMLAYSGRGAFVVELFDVGVVVTEMAGLLRAAVPYDVELDVEIAPGLPPVRGDVTQIRQVVMNLIVNAAESMGGAAGRVRVTVDTVELDEAVAARAVPTAPVVPGLYVRLRVADAGEGIDPAALARIFEPFFTTKFTGRGLGLAAALGIARGHGGGLAVESRPGSGTTMAVYLPPAADDAADATEAVTADLPAAPPRAPAAAAPAAAGPGRGLPGTVLVIDDDELVRTVVRRMLEAEHVAVEVAASGDAAVELVRSGPARFDAVILDLSMPGLVGVELVQALRAAGLVAPILLTSGHSEDVALGYVGSHGVAAFLAKPYAPLVLIDALRGIAAG